MNYYHLQLIYYILVMIGRVTTYQTHCGDYFAYENCDEKCRDKLECCTIREITTEVFDCTCVRSESICEQEASDDVVCLSPNKDPLGGRGIWNAYRKRYCPVTTTPRPSPIEPSDCTAWKITNICTFCISIIMTISVISYKIYRKRQRDAVRANMPLPGPSHPYQSTTENIDSEAEQILLTSSERSSTEESRSETHAEAAQQ